MEVSTVLFSIFKDRRKEKRTDSRDRRAAPRGRVLLSGKMVYGHGYSTDCTIRDISDQGARIVLPEHAALDDFYLIVIRHGVAHRAKACWTSAKEAGLSFIKSYDFADDTPAHLAPVRRLWADLALRPA